MIETTVLQFISRFYTKMDDNKLVSISIPTSHWALFIIFLDVGGNMFWWNRNQIENHIFVYSISYKTAGNDIPGVSYRSLCQYLSLILIVCLMLYVYDFPLSPFYNCLKSWCCITMMKICYKQIPDSIIIMCCSQKHGLRHMTIGGNQYHNYNVTALQQKDYFAIE